MSTKGKKSVLWTTYYSGDPKGVAADVIVARIPSGYLVYKLEHHGEGHDDKDIVALAEMTAHSTGDGYPEVEHIDLPENFQ